MRERVSMPHTSLTMELSVSNTIQQDRRSAIERMFFIHKKTCYQNLYVLSPEVLPHVLMASKDFAKSNFRMIMIFRHVTTVKILKRPSYAALDRSSFQKTILILVNAT